MTENEQNDLLSSLKPSDITEENYSNYNIDWAVKSKNATSNSIRVKIMYYMIKELKNKDIQANKHCTKCEIKMYVKYVLHYILFFIALTIVLNVFWVE